METITIPNDDILSEETAESDDFIYTSEGILSKKELLDFCLTLVNKNAVLDYNILTMLEIFDSVDSEDSDDTMEEEYTARILYPIRIVIIKSLMLHPNNKDMKRFKKKMNFKAMRIRAEGLKCEMRHEVDQIAISETALCVCQRPLSAKNVLVCNHCDTEVCRSCSHNLCAVTLKEMIDAQELKDDPAVEVDLPFWDDVDDEDEYEEYENCEDEDEDEEEGEEDEVEDEENDDEDEEEWGVTSAEGGELSHFPDKMEVKEETSDEEMDVDVVG